MIQRKKNFIIFLALFLFVSTDIYLFFFKDKKETNITPIHLKTYTEFEPTEFTLISYLLFKEFPSLANIVEKIIAAQSRVLILADQPVSHNEKEVWLNRYNIKNVNPDLVEIIPLSHETYWVRDFSPIPTAFTENIFDRYFLSGFRYRQPNLIENSASYQLALFLNLNLISSPIVMDGGNFISNGTDCIITDSFNIEENPTPSQDIVEKTYRNHLGCQNLHVLHNAPHDHIDMFAKFIDKKTLLINEIELPPHLPTTFAERDISATKAYKKQLDEIAKEMSAFYQIRRVPMPFIIDGIFRTYTNSLIINKKILVPQFRKNTVSDINFPDIEQMKKYEETVMKINNEFGYETVFIEADDLIAHGGGLHCITSQLPKNLVSLH